MVVSNSNISNNNNNLNNKQTQRRIVVNKNKFNAITAGIKVKQKFCINLININIKICNFIFFRCQFIMR